MALWAVTVFKTPGGSRGLRWRPEVCLGQAKLAGFLERTVLTMTMNTSSSRRAAGALALAAVAGLVGGWGCEEKAAAPTRATSPDNPSTVLGKTAKMAKDTVGQAGAQQQQTSAEAGLTTGETANFVVAGVTFTSPMGWAKGPVTAMRLAQFSTTNAGGEVQLVFFNTGGSARDNIDRWKRQIEGDDSAKGFKEEKKTIADLTVTVVSMEGTYSGMTALGGAAAPVPDTRFVGAVVEGPGGQIQIRMTGPRDAVRAAQSSFDGMLNGMTKR